MKVQLPHKFRPRSYQAEQPWAAYQRGIRRFVQIAHRRSGKDLNLWNFMVAQAVQRRGYYAYLFPFATQARKAIWLGMSREGVPFLDHVPDELTANKHDTEMRLTLVNGSVLQLVGVDNVDSLRSTNPIGLGFSEYAEMDPVAWDTLRPIVRENGGWAAFVTTPKGDNHAHALYQMARRSPEWFTQHLTIEDTHRDAPGEDGRRVITRDEYEQEIAEGMDEEFARQEYYCSFLGSTVGSYYGKILETHAANVRRVPWEPRLQVHTAWDLGLDDQTAIWFVQLPYGPDGEIRVIDHLESRQEQISAYVQKLREKPYTYGTHLWPHDGALMADAVEQLGLRPIVVLKRTASVVTDINTTRTIIPRCVFDAIACERGVSALKNYRKDFDATSNTFRTTPKHDWSSHSADAFRTLAMGLYAIGDDEPRHAFTENRFTGLSEYDQSYEESDFDPIAR